MNYFVRGSLLSVINFLPEGEGPSSILAADRLRHCNHGSILHQLFYARYSRFGNPFKSRIQFVQRAVPVNVEDFLLRYLLHSQSITLVAPVRSLQLMCQSARVSFGDYHVFKEVAARQSTFRNFLLQRSFDDSLVVSFYHLLEPAGEQPMTRSAQHCNSHSFGYHGVQCGVNACPDAVLKEIIITYSF